MLDADLLLVRYAPEQATKGPRVRRRFAKRVAETLGEALRRRGIDHRVHERGGRLFVDTSGDGSLAAAAVADVFGVASVSPVAVVCDAELDTIVRCGRERFHAAVQGKTYAVRAKRQGNHPFSSMDVERELGAALNEGATVNLDAPEVTVWVDVIGDTANLFDRRIRGPGGLPSAVQGRAVALMSGGFDSAVAAWRVMKRGVAVDYVFCNLGGAAYERMVLQVTKRLCDRWALGQRPLLHVIDFGELVTALEREVRPGYWQLVLKLLMYRAAEAVAEEVGAQAIVTGESIGQVSSQTLHNLHAVDGVVALPLLRPLIACDKQEIIDEARRIGTARLSERVKEYCGLGGSRPVIEGTRATARGELAKLEPELLARVVKARRTIDVLGVGAADMKQPYLFTAEVPSGAVLLDCNPGHVYRQGHAPGAVHHDPGEPIEGFRALDKDRTYVLYCDGGTRAAHLAELMQQGGYEAYAFSGGLAALLARLGVDE